MPRFNNVPTLQGNTRFDWLPRRVQCLLLLLVTIPLSVGFFMAAMHCVHTGKPIVLGNTSTDALEFFFYSVFGFVISGGIFAVLMGWAKSATPHISETHHKPDRFQR